LIFERLVAASLDPAFAAVTTFKRLFSTGRLSPNVLNFVIVAWLLWRRQRRQPAAALMAA
jgi:hypothetical protein